MICRFVGRGLHPLWEFWLKASARFVHFRSILEILCRWIPCALNRAFPGFWKFERVICRCFSGGPHLIAVRAPCSNALSWSSILGHLLIFF